MSDESARLQSGTGGRRIARVYYADCDECRYRAATLAEVERSVGMCYGHAPADSHECCAEWKPQTEKLNAPIILAQVRNPSVIGSEAFQFIAWRYCPWCGARRLR